MKSFYFSAFLIVSALILGTSCERHPASQTIPGYEEKQAAQSKNANEKKTVSAGKTAPAAQAPTFFHSENEK